jgi:hypothetical protein
MPASLPDSAAVTSHCAAICRRSNSAQLFSALRRGGDPSRERSAARYICRLARLRKLRSSFWLSRVRFQSCRRSARGAGVREGSETVFAVVMVSSGGHCRRRSLTQRLSKLFAARIITCRPIQQGSLMIPVLVRNFPGFGTTTILYLAVLPGDRIDFLKFFFLEK